MIRTAALATLVVGCLSACGGDGAPRTCSGGLEQAAVLTTFTFARQMPKGVSVGFDLDHHVAEIGDPMTCNHPSLTDPDGNRGIDNALSGLLPVIDAMTNGALDSIIQGGINNGMLLIGIDLNNVTAEAHDDCVDLTMVHLTGTPTIGTDKILDANQTFRTAHDIPPSHGIGAIADHTFTAGPFELALPVRLLDASFTAHVHNAYVKAALAGDGAMTGFLGGGLAVAEIVPEILKLNLDPSIKKLLPDLIQSSADLARDPATGDCAQLSATVVFSARNAFIDP